MYDRQRTKNIYPRNLKCIFFKNNSLEYVLDLWLRTNFRNKKENDQPIVNPVNVDIKTAGDDSYHLDNMHQRPILPLAKPYVKVDGPEESNSDEQKYVTSSLLLKIKAEEAEDDKTQLAGTNQLKIARAWCFQILL